MKYVVLLKLLYDELSFDRYSELNFSWYYTLMKK